MRRPLLLMGGLFVIGETAFCLLEESPIYAALAVLIGTMTIIFQNNKRKEYSEESNRKLLHLLLFLCLISGFFWSYAVSSTAGRIEKNIRNMGEEDTAVSGENEKLVIHGYILKIDKTSSGRRLTIRLGREHASLYLGDEEFEKYEKSDEKGTLTEEGTLMEEGKTVQKNRYLEDRFSENEEQIKRENEQYCREEDGADGEIDEVNISWEKLRNDKNFELKIEPGKYVLITGTLENIKGKTNPGENDMEQYYFGQGIHYSIKADSLKVLDRRGNVLRTVLYRIRCRAADILDSLYDEETSGVLKNMLLGDKSGLSDKTRLLYQRAGIIHILAISGLHVALLAGVIEMLLLAVGMRKGPAGVSVMIIVVLYGMLTGFSQATMRAVLMLILSKTALLVKRTSDMPTSMMEALLIMMIINPACIFSTGVLMSFAAIAGVWTGKVFYDRIFGREKFRELPEKLRPYAKNLLGMYFISVSVNIWMTPLIIFCYYEVPVYSLLTNVIATSILSLLIISAFAALICGFILSAGVMVTLIKYIADIFVTISSTLVSFYEAVCVFILKLPHSVIITGHVDVRHMLLIYLFYLICFGFMLRLISEKNGRKTHLEGFGRVTCLRELGSKIFIKGPGRKVCLRSFGRQNFLEGLCKKISFRGFDKNNYTEGGGVKISLGNPDKNCRSAGYDYVGESDSENESTKRCRWKKYIRGILIFTLSSVFMVTVCILSTWCLNYLRSEVVFLDVGQGDGNIIRTKEKKNYIVDSGSSDKGELGKYTLIPALKYYGISRIDAVFISHTDVDHVSGILYLLDNRDMYGIDIGCICYAAGTETDEVLEKIRASGVKNLGLAKGQMVDGCFEVIYPVLEGYGEDSFGRGMSGHVISVSSEADLQSDSPEENARKGNDYSLVLHYTGKNIDILYTGDIGQAVEEKISGDIATLDRRKIRILKCPHHGSRYSSSEVLLEAYSPDLTIISCGKNNRYGHPAQEAVMRIEDSGSKIIRTDQQGACIITWEGGW